MASFCVWVNFFRIFRFIRLRVKGSMYWIILVLDGDFRTIIGFSTFPVLLFQPGRRKEAPGLWIAIASLNSFLYTNKGIKGVIAIFRGFSSFQLHFRGFSMLLYSFKWILAIAWFDHLLLVLGFFRFFRFIRLIRRMIPFYSEFFSFFCFSLLFLVFSAFFCFSLSFSHLFLQLHRFYFLPLLSSSFLLSLQNFRSSLLLFSSTPIPIIFSDFTKIAKSSILPFFPNYLHKTAKSTWMFFHPLQRKKYFFFWNI